MRGRGLPKCVSSILAIIFIILLINTNMVFGATPVRAEVIAASVDPSQGTTLTHFTIKVTTSTNATGVVYKTETGNERDAGNNLLSTSISGSNKIWTFVAPSSAGSRVLTFYAKDSEGINYYSSKTVSFIVKDPTDTTVVPRAEVFSASVDPSQGTTLTQFTVKVITSTNATGMVYKTESGNENDTSGIKQSVDISGSNKIWTFVAPSAAGNRVLTFYAKDSEGINYNSGKTVSFTVNSVEDTKAEPAAARAEVISVSIDPVQGSKTRQYTTTVTTSTNATGLAYKTKSGVEHDASQHNLISSVSGNNKVWSFVSPMSVGSWELTFYAKDREGVNYNAGKFIAFTVGDDAGTEVGTPKDTPAVYDVYPGQKLNFNGSVDIPSGVTTVRAVAKRIGNFSYNQQIYINKYAKTGKFNLQSISFSALGEYLAVPGKFEVTILLKDKQGEKAYKTFTVNVVDPFENEEVRYLPETDSLYLRADLSKTIMEKSKGIPIVWVGAYDLEGKNWLYVTPDSNSKLGNLKDNIYEMYFPAGKLPRNKRIKFVFFADGYNIPQSISRCEGTEMALTPLPPVGWDVRYNWMTDELEAVADPLYSDVNGKSINPSVYLVVYDEKGKPLYNKSDNYTVLSKYTKGEASYIGKYFRSWTADRSLKNKFASLNLPRGAKYRVGIKVKGYEDQWSDELLKTVTIHKPEVSEWNILFDSYNQLVRVSADTSGINGSFKVLLCRQDNSSSIDISKALPGKYTYANYLQYSATAGKLALTHGKAYSYYLKVLNSQGDMVFKTEARSILPVAKPKIIVPSAGSNDINKGYSPNTNTKSTSKQLTDKIKLNLRNIQKTSDKNKINTYLSIVSDDLGAYQYYLKTNLKSVDKICTEFKEYQQFYLDAAEHAEEIKRLNKKLNEYTGLLDEKRILWKVNSVASKAGTVLDGVEFANLVTDLIDDIENKNFSYAQSVTPIIDKGASMGFGFSSNPLYSLTYESFKFTEEQWANLFSLISESNYANVDEIHSMSQLYCVGYKTVSTRGFRDGMDGRKENLDCVVDEIVRRADMKKRMDEMDKWWLHASFGQESFYTALGAFRKTLDKEQWITDRQTELYRSNYNKGKALREYMIITGK